MALRRPRRPTAALTSAPVEASVIELLDVIDPDAIPPHVQRTLEEIGPLLAQGLTHREIAERCERSADWVGARVSEIREAFLEQAREHLDELSPALRDRLLDTG